MKTLWSVFLCLAVFLLCPSVSQSSGRVSSCCLTTSETVLRLNLINSYYLQRKGGICPVDAVVFVTVKGIKVCANPDKMTWT
ncbi:hypothetical protein MATL_G00023330 [Megalops atlanticus]|uniref:C-C motif chemokine n=1 Tax=Megalops atlanticus TaxID=7932 RepID=A0A9D3QH42_MEGAT|nr:hypothetical protein MATL_G00023330 [Megalops atlanticus]